MDDEDSILEDTASVDPSGDQARSVMAARCKPPRRARRVKVCRGVGTE